MIEIKYLEVDNINLNFIEKIDNHSVQIMLSLAVMLFAGFFLTRITRKLRLPNVTGYILAGILIGPYALNLIPQSVIKGMDFVTDIALAFIAFGVGRYFKMSKLKKSTKKVVIITLFESLTACLFTTLVMLFIFHLSVPFSLLLGAIASATAPVSTIMTIRQYHAKGEFVDTILEVMALDNAVSLIAFSICSAIINALETKGGISLKVLFIPVILNLVCLSIGVLGGYILHWLVDDRKRSKYHRQVLVIAVILTVTGFCSAIEISPLLSCMLMGTVFTNIGGKKRIYHQVDNFTPAILLLFFVCSGMKLNIPSLATAGIIGLMYFFIRIIGKYIGAYLGCLISKTSLEIRTYLGLALIPQAGVSIGLAALAQRILPQQMGTLLSTIILSSGLLYEIVGPICAKTSLILAHSILVDEKVQESSENSK